MSLRTDKVSGQIHAICAQTLAEYSHDAASLVTMISAKVSPDLREAWLYISFFDQSSQSHDEQMTSLRPVLQAAVARQLQSKFTPKLHLVEDKSAQYAENITRKLKDI